MMNLSEVISFFLQTQQWNVITWRSTSNTVGEESTSTGSAGLRVCVCVFFKTNSGFVEYGTMSWLGLQRGWGVGGAFGIWYHLVPGCSGILFVFTNLVYSEFSVLLLVNMFSPPGFSTLDSDLYFWGCDVILSVKLFLVCRRHLKKKCCRQSGRKSCKLKLISEQTFSRSLTPSVFICCGTSNWLSSQETSFLLCSFPVWSIYSHTLHFTFLYLRKNIK